MVLGLMKEVLLIVDYHDEKINNYGKKLNSLCNSQNLVIANGRVIGDRVGNFTCQNSHGSSVVDYFITDRDFYNRLKLLVVHEPAFGSIHSPLSLTIECSVKKEKIKSPPLPKPPRFIWDPSKRDQFIDILKNKQVEFNALHNSLVSNDCTGRKTIKMAEQFADLLFKFAKPCFKLAKSKIIKKSRRKENSKSWYNDSCLSLKKRLLNQARLLKKNLNDSYIRGVFMVCKKEYRKCL